MTLVPYRRSSAKDGPRYKGIGNSWATTVALWVGQRIAGKMHKGEYGLD